ncbi:hypothetical protein HPB50_027544 [Hyalomma asiaticum]|uniref:Uncharacterized protein n=1 Tax=Hyalomma asiaticum TaxID=266040 RepID=A0ACB7T2N1_HYAAI|nr:hypothetical protein HPB50_027544 [Hyalomma asiaticum]
MMVVTNRPVISLPWCPFPNDGRCPSRKAGTGVPAITGASSGLIQKETNSRLLFSPTERTSLPMKSAPGTMRQNSDFGEAKTGSRDSSDKNRYGSRKTPSPAVFEHRIVEGETLQGLALRYGCTVGALRHFNNLLSDQDFFALTVIKVPDRIHVATGQLVDTNVPADDTISLTSDGAESPPDKAIRYWKSLDHKVQAALQQRGSGDDGIQIDELDDDSMDRHVPHSQQSDASSGADCGIGWGTSALNLKGYS